MANVGWLIVDDAELYATSFGNQTVIASDEVTRSQTGRIVSGTENSQSKSYTYDSAGRLTNATIGSNTYSYGFGAQNGSCGTGTNANSGKNFNRTSQTINSVTTSFCYDYADRLTSSSDPLADAAQYDAHGNMTQLGSGTTPMQLLYDSSDRNRALEQFNSSGTGTASYYNRDVHGRITYRETDTVTNWNWATTDEKWYGYTGNGGAPSFVRNANWDVVEKYLALPGGVLMTVRPSQTGNANKVYSLPNLSGAIMATTDAAGTLTGTFRYDPFGNKTSTTLPDNTSAGATLGWAGSLGKMTETSMALTPVQMGARVYLPTLGRFAQADPVPGGNANDYVYAGDPINSNDFSGKSLQGGSGASSLQPAAGVNRIQPTAPVTYYQPALSGRGVQTTRPATISVVNSPAPPPVPKRDDSTRMPVATIVKIDSVQSLMNVHRPELVETLSYNYLQAASSAYDYYKAGALLGGGIGCGGGALAFGPGGCIVIGGIGGYDR